jgi:hypothetical protein
MVLACGTVRSTGCPQQGQRDDQRRDDAIRLRQVHRQHAPSQVTALASASRRRPSQCAIVSTQVLRGHDPSASRGSTQDGFAGRIRTTARTGAAGARPPRTSWSTAAIERRECRAASAAPLTTGSRAVSAANQKYPRMVLRMVQKPTLRESEVNVHSRAQPRRCWWALQDSNLRPTD